MIESIHGEEVLPIKRLCLYITACGHSRSASECAAMARPLNDRGGGKFLTSSLQNTKGILSLPPKTISEIVLPLLFGDARFEEELEVVKQTRKLGATGAKKHARIDAHVDLIFTTAQQS